MLDRVRSVSVFERATAFQLDHADVSAAQLLAAAEVLEAIANVDLGPLEKAATTTLDGDPITAVVTASEQEAWATYSHALQTRDRAAAWAETLRRGSLRR